jgi:hypothetical protein
MIGARSWSLLDGLELPEVLNDVITFGANAKGAPVLAAMRRLPEVAPTSFTPFEARVRELLVETPDMPATVLAERVGWPVVVAMS